MVDHRPDLAVRYYDRTGRRIPVEESDRLCRDPDYVQVGFWADWTCEHWVYTYWVGTRVTDYAPLFISIDERGRAEFCFYSDLADAVSGHEALVCSKGGDPRLPYDPRQSALARTFCLDLAMWSTTTGVSVY